jgi:hypothetical protein
LRRRSLNILVLTCIIAALLSGCTGKHLNERVTLWRNDKIPYGTYYAYENLPHLFPDAGIEINKRSPDRNKRSKPGQVSIHDGEGSEKSAYVIIATSMQPDAAEVNALVDYVRRGNHVFVSAMEISYSLLDSLRLHTNLGSAFFNFNDSLSVSIEDPVDGSQTEYNYPGRAFDNYFSSYDTAITEVLGYDSHGKPNFVRFRYEGGGSLLFHLAPATFTNFFLLHGSNSSYYDKALSYLPENVQTVYWDDYFRYHRNGKDNSDGGKRNQFSKLGIFLNDPILKWALWLVVILFAILYLFESKRKQRIIPVKKPLKNASLDFVKTIGRLYYQRRDNKDLFSKMTAHWLDHIRTKYSISTSKLDESFEHKLAYKSGYDLAAIRKIVTQITMLTDQDEVMDEELLELNQGLENFYKHS